VKRLPKLAASLVLCALTACGGDSPTGTNGNTNLGDGSMTAAINGVAWRSMKAGDKGSHSGQIYAVVGLNGTYTIALGIAGLTAPGTVNLSLTNGNGSNAIVSSTAGAWGTAFNGGSGTITVTTLTANRIAGTFSFDAPAGSGNATGTLQVRNGNFDVTF